LITNKMVEMMLSQRAWYGIWWITVDSAPVLIVMMNHLW
jgi:hypothetical protein